jgi:hypothetical protein
MKRVRDIHGRSPTKPVKSDNCGQAKVPVNFDGLDLAARAAGDRQAVRRCQVDQPVDHHHSVGLDQQDGEQMALQPLAQVSNPGGPEAWTASAISCSGGAARRTLF